MPLYFSASKGYNLCEVHETNVWCSIFIVALARYHLKLNAGVAAEGTFPKRECLNVAVSRELLSLRRVLVFAAGVWLQVSPILPLITFLLG